VPRPSRSTIAADRRPIPGTPAAFTVLVALAMTLAACGAPASPSASSTPSAAVASPSPAATPGTAATPTPTASPSPSASATAPASPTPTPAAGDPTGLHVTIEPLVTGLTAPLLVTNAGDGSGRLFVVEQGGRIRIVEAGRLVERPFLDLSGRITSGGERGLLGLAFHPGFGPSEPRFYADYTDPDGNTVVSEFKASTSDPDVADPASERVLLHIGQPFANHNGGGLAFGPDGDLYVGMGDGGAGGDPFGNGQDHDVLLGKLLRIGVEPSGGQPYTIPPDNPFAASGGAGEVFAIGLRNPWRFSFDRATDDLWIGDVGQGAWEEIDRARAADGGGRGLDYGWNVMEGRSCYGATTCDQTGLTLPIAVYDHSLGCAVIGGYVYRGSALPALDGVYLFSDECSGRIWGLSSGGSDDQQPVQLADTGAAIASFGEDEAGELYAADLAGGRILRIGLGG